MKLKNLRNPILIIDIEGRVMDYMTKADLIISNKGLSGAKDIKLKAEHGTSFFPPESAKGKSKTAKVQLNELPIFKDGIPYLAPGRDICYNIGSFKNDEVNKNP